MAYQFTKTWAQIWALINNAMQIGVDYVTAGQYEGSTIGDYATAEGTRVTASGYAAHAEGDSTEASGSASHAEGNYTQATGENSHSEGADTVASGNYAHAEGSETQASGYYSHAEGDSSSAEGTSSHAEGSSALASGSYSHAEGYTTRATGEAAHAENKATTATGQGSHAEGYCTTANHAYQHVFGESNIPDPSTAAATARGNYVEIVGNGTVGNLSNARTLDWEGNEVLSGKLTIGKHGTDPMDVATVGEALNAYATDSASGAMASFPDGANAIPMKSFVCSIEPIQAGSGDPSPDNIRAISGHSGVNAVVAGVNIFDKSTVTEGSYIAADGTIGTSSSFALSDYIKVGGNSNVTLSGNSNWGSAPSVCFFDKDKQYISGTHPTTSPATLSIPYGAVYMRSSLASSSKNAFQVEIGSTASAYSAYNPTVYPVTFYDGADPLTVYKGTIDLVSGVLTVTHKIIDLGDYAYGYNSTNKWFSTSVSGIPSTNHAVAADIVADAYKAVSRNYFTDNMGEDGLIGINSTPNLLVRNLAYTDGTAFAAAMDGFMAVVPLATPLVYNLTPTEVLSLLGQNNCYNYCGDTAVEYRADTKLYIQKMLGGNVQTLSAIRPTLGAAIVEPTAEPEEEGGVDNE